MKNNTRRFLSLALAGTIIAGAHTATAYANDDTPISYSQEACTNYIVREGDTLGKIAKKFFGNAAYWEYLATFNNIEDANTIFPGDVIKIPDTWLYQPTAPVQSQAPIQNYVYDYTADNTYTVQKGDTLYCIVRVQYGLKNQEAVDKLATYNNLSDPNRLSVGQVLLIPSLEKLLAVQQRDYSEQYNRMGEILNGGQNKPNCHPCPPCPPCPGVVYDWGNAVIDPAPEAPGCARILIP